MGKYYDDDVRDGTRSNDILNYFLYVNISLDFCTEGVDENIDVTQ